MDVVVKTDMQYNERPNQIVTTNKPSSSFYRLNALLPNQQCQSTWRESGTKSTGAQPH